MGERNVDMQHHGVRTTVSNSLVGLQQRMNYCRSGRRPCHQPPTFTATEPTQYQLFARSYRVAL